MRLIVSAIALSVAALAHPCACVGHDGQNIRFAGQKNVIVWDPVTKTEHFVRVAGFMAHDGDMGFIAPTPTMPQLVAVEQPVFNIAEKILTRYETAVRENGLFAFDCRGGDMEAATAGAVDILREMDVGGYRAVTLKARDAEGFRKWLNKHDFSMDPTVNEWIQSYMKKDWIFTIFMVRSKDGEASTSPVRMTFKTDEPFAPYYVPKSNHPTSPSDLGVAFYAPGVYQSRGFHPDSVRKAPVSRSDTARLAGLLKLPNLPSGLALTVSHYRRFPNPQAKDDLYFTQVEDVPSWPLNLRAARPYIIGAIALLFVGWRLWLRRRARLPY